MDKQKQDKQAQDAYDAAIERAWDASGLYVPAAIAPAPRLRRRSRNGVVLAPRNGIYVRSPYRGSQHDSLTKRA